MAIITLLTDFGDRDHYVAALKAKIYTKCPEACIVDLTHQIKLCDINQAAFTLGAVFRDFPQGSIHLVGVNDGALKPVYVALLLEEHYFVGFGETGLWSLISEMQPTRIVQLNDTDKKSIAFPEKDILAVAAAMLARGDEISSLGSPYVIRRKAMALEPIARGSMLIGHIIHVDGYGNVITNITRALFEKFVGDRAYVIRFGKEKIHTINKNSYYEQPDGMAFVAFNSLNLLELGINKGHAEHLLFTGANHQTVSVSLLS